LGIPQLHFRESQFLSQFCAHFLIRGFINRFLVNERLFQLGFVLAQLFDLARNDVLYLLGAGKPKRTGSLPDERPNNKICREHIE
jgi:hypothetical protein